ncbi:MAG: CcdB family protein [Deltaproteobacteria bacterium]|nr:CcdB family protein [Deltaproteobacteria bacterium]MCW5807932.1 CcdB family protein [Deltaproteobacteria bacterium]
MTQFDVFLNPVSRARRSFPLVVVVQSDLARTGTDRMVAPLALMTTQLSGGGNKLLPRVSVAGSDHLIFVPNMTTIREAELREHRGQLGAYRSQIMAAIDYLFFGV